MADNEDLGLGENHGDSFDETNGMHDENVLNDTDGDGVPADDPELEAIKARVREMEEEAEKLKQLQNEVDKQMNMGSPPGLSKCLTPSIFNFKNATECKGSFMIFFNKKTDENF